jgi:hypothetical protein
LTVFKVINSGDPACPGIRRGSLPGRHPAYGTIRREADDPGLRWGRLRQKKVYE